MSAVKIKFVGLLRGLLRRFDEDDADAADERQQPRPVSAAAPQMFSAAPPAALPQPVVEPVAHAVPVNPDEIQMPLPPILAALPMELRGKIMTANTANMAISIPVDRVLPQLATGMVKITFGELRHLAAGVFANSGGEHDAKPVALPLHQVLAQINPVLLARRTAQKAGRNLRRYFQPVRFPRTRIENFHRKNEGTGAGTRAGTAAHVPVRQAGTRRAGSTDASRPAASIHFHPALEHARGLARSQQRQQ